MECDPRTIYSESFFRARTAGSVNSARVVVPLTLRLVRGVYSVVDVGCGAGEWLCVFKENGIQRVLGLDGGAAQNSGQLKIETREFRQTDLEQPLQINERYDLCTCLEVAEHLTEGAAPNLVRNLCDLSDIVLFSAAIPGQRGRNHINERWPSYWARYFKSCGYRPVDIIRGRLWNDRRIEIWYRQNILLFANKSGESRLSGANRAQSQRRRAERKLKDVMSSSSWRITKPFRILSKSMLGFWQAVSWK